MTLLNRVSISLIFLFMSFGLQAETEDPGKIVKQTVEQVLNILRDDKLDEKQKKEKISDIAKQRINFKDMSRRILAVNWRKASEEQRTEFTLLFQEILLNTYWIRMRQYAGERVEYIAVSKAEDVYSTVDTIIVRDQDRVEIPLSYRMRRFVDIWYAYDFTVEYLSLVQSYRNEYRATVKNHGIDGLLDLMQQEVESYDA